MLWVAVIVVVFFGLIIWYTLTVLADKRDQTSDLAAAGDQAVEMLPAEDSPSTGSVSPNAGLEALLATDDRIVLTPDNLGDYSKNANGLPDCEAGFVVDDATSKFVYTDTEYGFEVALPFNLDWGSEDYRVEPFDELAVPLPGQDDVLAAIQFGPMAVGEGCGWYRFDRLSVRGSRTADQIIAAVTAEQGEFPPIVAPREVVVGGYQAVEYDYGGLCSQPVIELVGGSFNIVASKICGFLEEPEADFGYLRDILETLEIQ